MISIVFSIFCFVMKIFNGFKNIYEHVFQSYLDVKKIKKDLKKDSHTKNPEDCDQFKVSRFSTGKKDVTIVIIKPGKDFYLKNIHS